tara:strand:- start:148 stop:342 length:195 start_codon:yes stop_codon:yes gene_type:complete
MLAVVVVAQIQVLQIIKTVTAVMAVAAMQQQMILQPKMAPQILAVAAVAVLTLRTSLAVMAVLE